MLTKILQKTARPLICQPLSYFSSTFGECFNDVSHSKLGTLLENELLVAGRATIFSVTSKCPGSSYSCHTSKVKNNKETKMKMVLEELGVEY